MKKTVIYMVPIAALTLCLFLFALCPRAKASEPFEDSCGPNATYHFENGVLTISGTGPITSHPWAPSRLLDPGIRYSITSVIIEDGVTSLPDEAFFNCENLVEIDIPNSVTSIGSHAFQHTPWLEKQSEEFVVVGSGILLSYHGAGSDVTIPDSVHTIGGSAFEGANITDVTIGSSVTEIGPLAFADCTELMRVNISTTVKRVGYDAFVDTPWLGSRTESFVIVGDGILIAYQGPGGAVVIPDTVRVIAPYSMRSTQSGAAITEVTIPDSVVEIGENAFQGGFSGVREPLPIHGALDSAVEAYIQSQGPYDLYRFIPFGQEDGSLFNFVATEHYFASRFIDIERDQWYYEAVETVCSRKLMNGRSDDTFAPGGNISVAEAIAIAARMRDIYYYEQTAFVQGEPWYRTYADYALDHSILIQEPDNYQRLATRAEFASLLAAALPGQELEEINESISFADISEGHPFYEAVMRLSKAGVTQGKSANIFDPNAPVLRSEAAAMLSRCICPGQRLGME